MPVSGAYVGAAVIAASAALLGIVLGKEQKTTEFRQEWINAQRDDLAILLAFARTRNGSDGSEPHPSEFHRAHARILLRENPDNREWRYVLEEIEGLRRSIADDGPVEVQGRYHSRIVELSQRLLKTEWGRVKAGERPFRVAKHVLPILVLLTGCALAYGEGFIRIG